MDSVSHWTPGESNILAVFTCRHGLGVSARWFEDLRSQALLDVANPKISVGLGQGKLLLRAICRGRSSLTRSLDSRLNRNFQLHLYNCSHTLVSMGNRYNTVHPDSPYEAVHASHRVSRTRSPATGRSDVLPKTKTEKRSKSKAAAVLQRHPGWVVGSNESRRSAGISKEVENLKVLVMRYRGYGNGRGILFTMVTLGLEEVWNKGPVNLLAIGKAIDKGLGTYPMAKVAVNPINARVLTRSLVRVSTSCVLARFGTRDDSPSAAEEASCWSEDEALRLLPRALDFSSLFASSTISFAFAMTPSVDSGRGRSGCEAGTSTVTEVLMVSTSLSFSTVSWTEIRTTSSLPVIFGAFSATAEVPLANLSCRALEALRVVSTGASPSVFDSGLRLAALEPPRFFGDAVLRGVAPALLGEVERLERARVELDSACGGKSLDLSAPAYLGGDAMAAWCLSLDPTPIGSGSRRAMIHGRIEYSVARAMAARIER
jgi:hypothetical protein